MRRLTAFVAMLSMVLAAMGALAATPASATTTTCPPNPPADSTVTGDLVVPAGSTNVCTLTHVTVTGNVRVGQGATLRVWDNPNGGSKIAGNITLDQDAALDFEDSTVKGSVSATDPRYVAILDFGPPDTNPTNLGYNVNVSGAQQFVELCGAHVTGSVNISGGASGAPVIIGGSHCNFAGEFLYDGGYAFFCYVYGAYCIGQTNTLDYNVNLRENQGHVYLEKNNVRGSVTASRNTGGGDIDFNTITQNLYCSLDSPAFNAHDNTVGGNNTC